MSALVYENVEKSFGGVHALSDLNIRFETGRIYSIIGPNGAGKSTAVNLAAGSYRASAGRIRLGETDITDLPKHRIAQLGLARTYQNIRLFDEMTVVENLEVAWAWREVGSIWREVLFPGSGTIGYARGATPSTGSSRASACTASPSRWRGAWPTGSRSGRRSRGRWSAILGF